MLAVKLINDDFLSVKIKYAPDYIQRLKRMPNIQYDPESKIWYLHRGSAVRLDKEFRGEILYITPRWQMLNLPSPDYRAIYANIPNHPVTLENGHKLYDFQLFGANFCAHTSKLYGMALLADDMGIGKTVQAIGAVKILKQQHDLSQYDIPVLVVCKSSLKYQWQADGIKKFTNYDSVVIDGTPKKRKDQYNNLNGSIFVITNYELIIKDIEILENLSIGITIFDEAHKIRNHQTLTNKQCRRLNAEYKIFLTGSPVSSKPDEIFGICTVGNKDILGGWSNFARKHIVKGYYPNEILGYKNLDSLRGIVDQVSLRRTEREVAMELPRIVGPQLVELQMTQTQRIIDNKLKEELQIHYQTIESAEKDKDIDPEKKQELLNTTDNYIKMLMTIRQSVADSPELILMSKSPAVKDKYADLVKDTKSNKLDYLIDHLNDIRDSGNQAVVFSKYETMTRIIQRELTKAKIKVLTFTGKHNTKQKEAIRTAFKNNPDITALVCTNAGAEGLSLENARYLINFDTDWDISVNDQRNKRIRRLDSPYGTVFVFNYMCIDSVDYNVMDANARKQALFDVLIENNDQQSDAIKRAMSKF